MANLTWINPIFDRTQLDIVNRTNKGFLNYTDLNRIENNIEFLFIIISGGLIDPRRWSRGEFPRQEHFDRLISLLTRLKQFYPDISVNVPSTILNFKGINDAERIIFETKQFIGHGLSWDGLEETFITWGSFESVGTWERLESEVWYFNRSWNITEYLFKTWSAMDVEGLF